MNQALIPYNRPYAPAPQVAIAGTQGVFVTIDEQALDLIVETFERWFSEREDVIFVDYGTTDKKPGLGYLIMEWMGYEVDRLFLDILDSTDVIEDYTAYARQEM